MYKKPQGKKPVAPRKPSVGTKKPMAKKVSSGIVVALPNGSTIGLKDIGKVKPTPKPKPKTTTKPKVKPTPKTTKMTPQDSTMKKILEGLYGKIYGK